MRWQNRDAKAKLSEVIEKAITDHCVGGELVDSGARTERLVVDLDALGCAAMPTTRRSAATRRSP